MGLETGTYISDLDITNPVSGDGVSQGDDHLRLIKTVLKNTFPNAGGVYRFPTVDAKSANFSVAEAELNVTFYVDTSGGAVTVTLPTLAVELAGWECVVCKITDDVNPMIITPPSGLVISGALGLATTRRCIPGTRIRITWTGAFFLVERAVNVPVGSVIPYAGANLPVGYEWPNGQTLTSVATNYPDYNEVRGSGTTPDLRGRVMAGKDDMGGSSANRLTSPVNGDTLEAAGGDEAHTLTTAQMPSHDHGGLTGFTQAQFLFQSATPGFTTGANVNIINAVGSGPNTANTLDHQHTITSEGGNDDHNNVQPTIIENFLLVVE